MTSTGSQASPCPDTWGGVRLDIEAALGLSEAGSARAAAERGGAGEALVDRRCLCALGRLY